MKPHKRKTVLIVDDDRAACRYLASKLISDSNLTPLTTDSLEEAESLLRDKQVQIDAVLADFFFEAAESTRSDLVSGLDVLRVARVERPAVRCYLMSFFADSREIKESRFGLDGVFEKQLFVQRDGGTPWSIIERDLLGTSTPAPPRKRKKSRRFRFDVFLAHNSKDKDEVERIARHLEALGVTPWLDRWEIPPGRTFQDEICKALPLTRSVAVFIGKGGIGPWQDFEQKAAISEFVKTKAPVIPVYLSSFDGTAEIPLFLREFSSVRFSDALPFAESLSLIVWGIRGTQSPRKK